MKSMAVRGILIGWLAFLLIAMIAYVTPARVLVVKHVGRDYAVIRLLESRQNAVKMHQPRALAAEIEARLQDWRRTNATISPFGIISWISDLWPWLIGLGFALPVLGGLIGAQVPRKGSGFTAGKSPDGSGDSSASRPHVYGTGKRALDTDSQTDARMWGVRHPPVPDAVPAKDSSVSAEIPNPNLQPEHAGEATPRTSESPRPADPATWNWSARPVVRPVSARPKPPPVKSPHGEKNEE